MLIDSVRLPVGGKIVNATIESAVDFPSSPTTGAIFYKTGANAGFYFYNGSGWEVASTPTVGDTAYLNVSGDAMTGPLTLAGNPSQDMQAATKAYVDTAVSAIATGLDYKDSVYVATDGPINLNSNQYIDGLWIDVTSGKRVLVKNQADATKNGIYVAAGGALTRASDFNGSPTNEVSSGAYVYVEAGSTNGGTGWVLTTQDPITIGSTALTFTKISSTVVTTPTIPHDIAVYCNGKPDAAEKLAVLKVTTAFGISSGLAGSYGISGVAATGSSVFSLKKNGTQFGTITFGAGATVATLTAASATSFAIGDIFQISAPDTQDATLADISITVKGIVT